MSWGRLPSQLMWTQGFPRVGEMVCYAVEKWRQKGSSVSPSGCYSGRMRKVRAADAFAMSAWCAWHH